MEDTERQRLRERANTYIEVQDGGINIQEVHHFYQADMKKGGSGKGLVSDDELRDRINHVMHLITKNRLWYPIAKVLMLHGQAKNKDFQGVAERIKALYPAGLEYDIDPADLQSMHVGSFTMPVDEWVPDDGPVKRDAEFKQYVRLAQQFEAYFK